MRERGVSTASAVASLRAAASWEVRARLALTEGEKGRGERADGRFEGERDGGEHSGGGGKRGYVLRGEGKEGVD